MLESAGMSTSDLAARVRREAGPHARVNARESLDQTGHGRFSDWRTVIRLATNWPRPQRTGHHWSSGQLASWVASSWRAAGVGC